MRHLLCFFIISVTSQILAAPVPKENEKTRLVNLYGIPEDPDKHCEFRLEGTELVVKMAADLNSSATSLKGAPRTSRSITGNFEVTVGVKYAASKDPAGDTTTGHLGGGLAAWTKSGDFALVNRHHWPSPGASNGSNWSGGFDVHVTGSSGATSHGATCDEVTPDKVTHLKLTRVGNTVATFESRDAGKTWNKLTESQTEYPDALNVGVAVFNTTGGKGVVTFSRFEIQPLK